MIANPDECFFEVSGEQFLSPNDEGRESSIPRSPLPHLRSAVCCTRLLQYPNGTQRLGSWHMRSDSSERRKGPDSRPRKALRGSGSLSTGTITRPRTWESMEAGRGGSVMSTEPGARCTSVFSFPLTADVTIPQGTRGPGGEW